MSLTAAHVKAAARDAGFHACGIARAAPLDPGPLDRVLERGYEADMVWLRTQRAERLDPARLLPGARSVVVVALAYHAGEEPPPAEGAGDVARYARGRDYHAVMKRRLKALAAALADADPGVRTLATCDVAPTMEKTWAERAGVGWVGKNGCLITTTHGSWVVLGTVLVDRELEPDAPHPERCGSCDACLPACPTGAIPEPGLVDARRCLSFWTIERRGPVPPEIAGRLGRWVFGCDDCQTVCPWNAARPSVRPERSAAADGAESGGGACGAPSSLSPRSGERGGVCEAPSSLSPRSGERVGVRGECALGLGGSARRDSDPELLPRPGRTPLALGDLLALTEDEYRARFYGTSLARARFDGLVRNAILVAGGSGDRRWAAAIRPHLESPHEAVRAAAQWALAALGER